MIFRVGEEVEFDRKVGRGKKVTIVTHRGTIQMINAQRGIAYIRRPTYHTLMGVSLKSLRRIGE